MLTVKDFSASFPLLKNKKIRGHRGKAARPWAPASALTSACRTQGMGRICLPCSQQNHARRQRAKTSDLNAAFSTAWCHITLFSPGAFARAEQQKRCSTEHQTLPRMGFKRCRWRRLITWHQDALGVRSHTNAAFLQIYATWHAIQCKTMCLHKMLKTQQVSNATALKTAIAHSKAHPHKPKWAYTHTTCVGSGLSVLKNMLKCIL